MQPRKLHCCIWRDSIKPSLRFSWFCVFLVSKGNPFRLLFLQTKLRVLLKGKALIILLVSIEMHSLLLLNNKRFKRWSCQKVRDAFSYLLNNIFIRFGFKLHRKRGGIPMRTDYTLLAANFFFFFFFFFFFVLLWKKFNDVSFWWYKSWYYWSF